MKRTIVLSFVGTLLVGTVVAQTSGVSQTNASASQSTSVSADKSGGQLTPRARQVQHSLPNCRTKAVRLQLPANCNR
jgi:hypothetical protein